MIPFLVADRPISLSIIKGITLPPGGKIGILSHAFTTENFRSRFAHYPETTEHLYGPEPDDAILGVSTVRFADSGIFSNDAAAVTYSQLFDRYDDMQADYGVIMDRFGDREGTYKTAVDALDEYNKKARSFELVGVAQGKTVDDYMAAFEELIELGYTRIAIGGLLVKRENTARFLYVRSIDFVESVLSGVREKFDPEWLFAFGIYHQKRAELLEEYKVWGADYKGWIFNYVKKEEALQCLESDPNPKEDMFDDAMTRDAITAMSEQELRLRCVRNFVRRRVLDPLVKPSQPDAPATAFLLNA